MKPKTRLSIVRIQNKDFQKKCSKWMTGNKKFKICWNSNWNNLELGTQIEIIQKASIPTCLGKPRKQLQSHKDSVVRTAIPFLSRPKPHGRGHGVFPLLPSSVSGGFQIPIRSPLAAIRDKSICCNPEQHAFPIIQLYSDLCLSLAWLVRAP